MFLTLVQREQVEHGVVRVGIGVMRMVFVTLAGGYGSGHVEIPSHDECDPALESLHLELGRESGVS